MAHNLTEADCEVDASEKEKKNQSLVGIDSKYERIIIHQRHLCGLFLSPPCLQSHGDTRRPDAKNKTHCRFFWDTEEENGRTVSPSPGGWRRRPLTQCGHRRNRHCVFFFFSVSEGTLIRMHQRSCQPHRISSFAAHTVAPTVLCYIWHPGET